MRFAIEHGFDYLLNLDADFSHPPRVHPRPAGGHGRPRRDDRLALRARRRRRGRVHPQAPVHEHRDQQLRPADARPDQPATTAARSAATASASWPRSTSTGSGRAATRSRRRSSSGARRSAAGSARRRSCSRTAARASRRSTCARPSRRSGSCSSSACRAGGSELRPRPIAPKQTAESAPEAACRRRKLRRRLDQAISLADGHVDFLAGLGDLLAQSLVLALELAGVHRRAPCRGRRRGRRRPRWRAGRAIPRSGRPGRAGTGPVP